ncbi:hypothetical protein DACRYDRAFT_104021 [Dacryopinax primogenitus]|uniref:Uncharacterized protein n=1 Tax=Dacryopinax primogenitus (strain DJM 731) TaxID=1858805 RepID=M5GAX4_DACPD|nr:uncharacterized protein DACRYDRAFT_104021 [Dacryopinax primogenitus]EJU05535.1 hypothetical protein DACRYDRAFT_104021 [Dacryopinax primogenitus]
MQQAQKKPELVTNNVSGTIALVIPDRKPLSADTDLGRVPMTPASAPAPPPTSPIVGLPFFDPTQFASSISNVLSSAEWTGRFPNQEEQKK